MNRSLSNVAITCHNFLEPVKTFVSKIIKKDNEIAKGEDIKGAIVQGVWISIASDDCFVYFAMLVMIYCSNIDDIQSGHSKKTLGIWK